MHKCPLCEKKYKEAEALYLHVEDKHADMIPEGYTGARYCYKMRTGKTHGSCVVCKGDTEWNEKTNKYHRFCNNPKCKEEYRETFKKRMVGKYGKTSLLDDPEQQKKMLQNRKISGVYNMNGKEIPYVGSYEYDFLRMLDLLMDWDEEDIMAPSPHTYWYMYEGKKHFYIPDFYIPSLDLEIEIKDGRGDMNMHHKIQEVDKVKERNKDEVMKKCGRNYIKVLNKEYDNFFTFLKIAKEQYRENINKPIIITESVQVIKDEFVMENNILDQALIPVYILLTYTGTFMAKGIRLVTKQPYSHAGISLTSDLTKVYTYGRKEVADNCKFTAENIHSGLMGFFSKDIKYALYVSFFNNEEYKNLCNFIEEIKHDVSRHGYSYMGLLNFALGRETHDEKMFCSQFVSAVIKAGDPSRLNRHESLYSPTDLRRLSGTHFVTRGKLSNYDKEKVDIKVDKIRNKLMSRTESTMVIESFSQDRIYESRQKFAPLECYDVKEEYITEFKNTYPSLSHIRISDNTKGNLYTTSNRDKLVAIINTEDKNGEIWIQALEIFGKFKGSGMSLGLLDIAVKDLNATHLSVNKKNTIAYKLYLDYGFTVYDETTSMYFMSIK